MRRRLETGDRNGIRGKRQAKRFCKQFVKMKILSKDAQKWCRIFGYVCERTPQGDFHVTNPLPEVVFPPDNFGFMRESSRVGALCTSERENVNNL